MQDDHVSTLNKRHTMVLELVKDSFNEVYPDEEIDLFTNNENDRGLLYSDLRSGRICIIWENTQESFVKSR